MQIIRSKQTKILFYLSMSQAVTPWRQYALVTAHLLIHLQTHKPVEIRCTFKTEFLLKLWEMVQARIKAQTYYRTLQLLSQELANVSCTPGVRHRTVQRGTKPTMVAPCSQQDPFSYSSVGNLPKSGVGWCVLAFHWLSALVFRNFECLGFISISVVTSWKGNGN